MTTATPLHFGSLQRVCHRLLLCFCAMTAASGTSDHTIAKFAAAANQPTTQPAQDFIEPVLMNDGVAWTLLSADASEYDRWARRLDASDPYVRVAVMDDLLAILSGARDYPLPKVSHRSPHEVLARMLDPTGNSGLNGEAGRAEEGLRLLSAVAVAFKAGVVAQSNATRRSLDTAVLAERYRSKIVAGAKSGDPGQQALIALEELLSIWPPLGASPDELTQITGLDSQVDRDDAEGVLLVHLGSPNGLSMIAVTFTFQDGRLGRVGFSPGA